MRAEEREFAFGRVLFFSCRVKEFISNEHFGKIHRFGYSHWKRERHFVCAGKGNELERTASAGHFNAENASP